MALKATYRTDGRCLLDGGTAANNSGRLTAATQEYLNQWTVEKDFDRAEMDFKVFKWPDTMESNGTVKISS